MLNYLSKSKYMRGLSCPRLLWFDINQPEMIPDFDAGTKFRLEMGHEVGDLAKQLYSDGIEIVWGSGFQDAVTLTQEALKQRMPLFEATFKCSTMTGYLLARADVLVPVGDDAWDMIEVKSSNSLKEDYYQDVAFQKFVLDHAGIKLRNCYLMHLNPNFRRLGEINPSDILIKEDITVETGKMLNDVEPNANRLLEMLSKPDPPDVDLLKDCRSISGCDLSYHCWDFLPQHHVGELYFDRNKKWDLLERNIKSLLDIPSSFPLTYKQEIQKAAVESNQPFVDKDAIKDFLNNLVYPCYYMDFETVQTPIPLFDGLSPWAQLPFQYSVHKEAEPGAPLKSFSYIGDLQHGNHDPRYEFMKGLQDCLGDAGSIVAFNAPFEKRCLRETAATYQEFGEWVNQNVYPRVVDLIKPFRSFAYYHPDQNGSCSLKKVLPAVTGIDYSDLDIGDGGTASVEYLRMSLGSILESEALKIHKSLEEYCGRDTEALAWIVNKLRELRN